MYSHGISNDAIQTQMIKWVFTHGESDNANFSIYLSVSPSLYLSHIRLTFDKPPAELSHGWQNCQLQTMHTQLNKSASQYNTFPARMSEKRTNG